MPTVQEELATLREWLQAEKEEGYEQFRNLIERMPLSERQKKGFSWYPVDIRKSGYTFGERAYVVLEFAAALDHPHQFRSGKPVRLFTQQAHVHRPEQNGVINYVQKGKMKIVLNTKDLPDWLGGGQIGVDLMFDERSYLEMEKALKLVMNAEKNRLAELRDILLGHRSPQLAPPHTVNNPILNQSQNRALQHILASKDVSIVHGPPGTGKTTTIVQAIRLLSQQESTLLVCAPSNTAVDLLSERLAAEGLRVVRVGNISRVDESLIEHTLDAQLAQHPESKNIKKIKIKAAECRRSARRYRRKFGSEERNAKRELLAEAKELTAWANQLEERLINQILDSAQVICCTLVSSTNKVLDRRHFRTLVIDEAAQALEPATWIPITKASKIILTGDPFQLPPTVKSIKAQKGGLEITLLEKCIQRFKKVNLLQVQYR
ncbi:MAG: AAA domain-containing protein, partial [Bacteroidota bacterium]